MLSPLKFMKRFILKIENIEENYANILYKQLNVSLSF